MTSAQRRKVCKANAQKSTGPKDTSLTRFNALSHGLRARVAVLPNEDPEAFQARADAWNDFYRPRDPGEQHLVNECVHATILADRCRTFHDAEVSMQVREADHSWNLDQIHRQQRFIAMLKDDPVNALLGLERFGHGVAYLIERWEGLEAALNEHGYWPALECSEATRLSGYRAEVELLQETPNSWLIQLANTVCRHADGPINLAKSLQWLCERERMPDEFVMKYSPTFYPTHEGALSYLRTMISDRLTRLRTKQQELSATTAANMAAASDRALIIRDDRTARLYLRYHAESRITFHRAYSALVKTIANRPDEDETVEMTPSEEAVEPSAEAISEPLEATSPNEANTPLEPPSSAESDSTSDAPAEAKKPSSEKPTKVYDPKEDVGLIVWQLMNEDNRARDGSEAVPITIISTDS